MIGVYSAGPNNNREDTTTLRFTLKSADNEATRCRAGFRYVLAWELDQTLGMPFVLSTIDRALLLATPDICNSDQGSHFTSPQYLERLLAKEVRISMDGKGRALDNIFTERLWRSVPPIKP